MYMRILKIKILMKKKIIVFDDKIPEEKILQQKAKLFTHGRKLNICFSL